MLISMKYLNLAQNIGIIDRIFRGAVALHVIGLPLLSLEEVGLLSWHGYVILLGVYPSLTAILGWDPFYVLFGVSSCEGSYHKQRGKHPHEMNAGLGYNLAADGNHDFDQSMSAVHLESTDRVGRAVNDEVQNRILALAAVILTLSIMAYVSWLSG
jgi:hypothetical protein